MGNSAHTDQGYAYPYPASRYPYRYRFPRHSTSQSTQYQLPHETPSMGEVACAPSPELSENPVDQYSGHPHETPEMGEAFCTPLPASPETLVDICPDHSRATEPTAQLPSPTLSPTPAPIRPKRGRPLKYKRDENGKPIKTDENGTPIPRGKYCAAGRDKGKGRAKTGNGRGRGKPNGKTEAGPSCTPAKRGRRFSAQQRGGRDKDDDDDKGRDKGKGNHKVKFGPKYEQLEPKYTDEEYKALAQRIEILLWQGQTPRFDLVMLAREAPNRQFTRLETYVRELFDDPILVIRLEAGIDKPKVRPMGPENAGWTQRYPEQMKKSDEWAPGALWRGKDEEL